VPCGATDQREFGYVTLNYKNRRPIGCSRASRFDTRLPRSGHDLLAFQMQTPNRSSYDSRSPMPTVMLHASAILGEFEQAQSELVGKAVILTEGMAGTVEKVWLDELHGLRISIKCHDGKWPVSTIKFVQS
jgi:hypothetical protein